MALDAESVIDRRRLKRRLTAWRIAAVVLGLLLFGAREGILDRSAVNQALPHFRDLPPEQGRIAIYRRGYHLLLRDFNQYAVYDDMAAWMRDPSTPLPSGADKRGEDRSIDGATPAELARRALPAPPISS